MSAVVTLYFLRFVGDESESYVEARQKEVRLTSIVIKEAQEKSMRRCCKVQSFCVPVKCSL